MHYFFFPIRQVVWGFKYVFAIRVSSQSLNRQYSFLFNKKKQNKKEN